MGGPGLVWKKAGVHGWKEADPKVPAFSAGRKQVVL